MNNPNIGWLYYRDYYQKLKEELLAKGRDNLEDLELDLETKNERIFQQRLSADTSKLIDVKSCNCSFTAKTRYPGLMVGTGTQHSIQNAEELKLGFAFDHTTGLPYIPASSVKGLVRSFFPSRLKQAASKYEPGSPKEVALRKKAVMLEKLITQFLLPNAALADKLSTDGLKALELHIFEGINPQDGKPQSIYNRDIFFDAYPVGSFYKGKAEREEGRFLGAGAITPHGRDPLKNPIPIRFLKILPEVVFKFQFQLHSVNINGVNITELHKYMLFQQIITRFGVGAKTNVGYGKMVEGNNQ